MADNQSNSVDIEKTKIKTLVRSAYQLQKLRIQTGNRVVANCKFRLGQAPSEPESSLSKEALEILTDLRAEHKRLTDAIVGAHGRPPKAAYVKDGLISDQADFVLVKEYFVLERSEVEQFKALKAIVRRLPIWNEFFVNVKGIGETLAGVLYSEFDISKAKYPSSLWKYAGLDVAEDGTGRSKRKEHLIDRDYTDKDGKPKTRKSITFNPFLKTKLIGVAATSFLRSGIDKPNSYARYYYNYKSRLENDPKHTDKSPGHRHNMALRYMVKVFLVDLYKAWRALEGLPVAPPFKKQPSSIAA